MIVLIYGREKPAAKSSVCNFVKTIKKLANKPINMGFSYWVLLVVVDYINVYMDVYILIYIRGYLPHS
jgi:hypothetical protein